MHVLATGAKGYRQYASYMTETDRGNVYKINIWWLFKRFIFFGWVTGGRVEAFSQILYPLLLVTYLYK